MARRKGRPMTADRTNPLWLAEPLLGPVCVHELTRAGRRFVNLAARVGYLVVVAWILFLFVWESWDSSAGRSDPRKRRCSPATRYPAAMATASSSRTFGRTHRVTRSAG